MRFFERKKQSHSSGFTMIELLVVTTIIIVLTTIGVVSYKNVGVSSRDARRKTDLETVRQALVMYKADNGSYFNPTSGADGTNTKYTNLVTKLGTDDYLSTPVPQDPKASNPGYTYSTSSCNASGCSEFTLIATLESASTWSISNP